MTEHIVPMFTITRAEIAAMFDKKIASIGPTRAKLESVIDGSKSVLLSAQRDGVKNGLAFLDEVEAKAVFMRDHLMEQERWNVTAAQLVEIHTSLSPIDVNLDQIALAIEPGKELQKETHNFTGRQARW